MDGRIVRDCYGRWDSHGVQRGARGIEVRFSDGARLVRVFDGASNEHEDACSCQRSRFPRCAHTRWLDSQRDE